MGSPKPRRSKPLVPEDEVLESIRERLGTGNDAFARRDDAAALTLPPSATLVVSVDSVVEGVHADASVCTPGDMGWKALMGALSDLAAMGATPLGALVALCVPADAGQGEQALGVMAGVAEASAAAGCPVVGGDVSEAAQLVACVTVLGTVPGADESAPVSRAGARAGDAVLVTGACGGSAAGLRALRAGAPGADASRSYRRPLARLREGEVARRAGAHAMIDISDGLALDLHRLAEASGVGFALSDVPVSEGATLADALGGGEDYELLITLGEDVVPTLGAHFEAAGLRPPVRIGTVVDDPSARTLDGRPLERLGWQHRIG